MPWTGQDEEVPEIHFISLSVGKKNTNPKPQKWSVSVTLTPELSEALQFSALQTQP